MTEDVLFTQGDEAYEKGNFEMAFSLFMKAAEKGDTSAMNRVASMYTCGEGVICNYDKSIDWERKALELGDRSSIINLGITYRIKGDIRQAKDCFENAFEQGDGEAALELAKLYMVSDKELDKVIEYLNLVLNSQNVCEDSVEEAKILLLEYGKAEP